MTTEEALQIEIGSEQYVSLNRKTREFVGRCHDDRARKENPSEAVLAMREAAAAASKVAREREDARDARPLRQAHLGAPQPFVRSRKKIKNEGGGRQPPVLSRGAKRPTGRA